MSDSVAEQTATIYPTRRDLRDARTGARSDPRTTARTDHRRRPPIAAAAPSRTPVRRRRSVSRTVLSAVVMTFAAGLIATIALPSYAFVPASAAAAHRGGAAAAQRLVVDADVQAADSAPDKVTSTRVATLKRKAIAEKFFGSGAYTGKSAADYLKDPKHPSFSLSAVFHTALKYRGVPYVFGGATPAGFDCSGFVMYVYAQYGISVAHSVHMIDDAGTRISEADAEPGDLVVFNDESHIGFYAGDGEILHAPNTGGVVRVQKLWSSDVHFIRLGI